MRIAVLAIIFSSCTLISFGQSRNCTIGSATVPCSPSWSDIRPGGDGPPYVAVHQEANVTLFASQIPNDSKTKESYEESLAKMLEYGLALKQSKVRVKDSRDFWGDSKYSQFEETKGAKAVFDGESGKVFHVHYSVFSHDGKKFIAGFSRLMFEGKNAEARFEKWIGGGGSGDRELRELIYSVTGEATRIDLPGGPPPPASKPLPGGPPPAKRPVTN